MRYSEFESLKKIVAVAVVLGAVIGVALKLLQYFGVISWFQ